MGETIIDCGGNNEGLFFYRSGLPVAQAATVQDLTIINPDDAVGAGKNAIESINFNMTIRRVEFYTNTPQEVESVISVSYRINDLSSLIEDVYLHNITVEFGAISVYALEGATSTGNVIRRVTVSDIIVTTAAGGQVINYATYDDGGTISGSIENITFGSIDTPNTANLTYISAIADSSLSGGDGSVNVQARNITVVGNVTPGITIISLVAVSIAPGGSSADANIDFQNVLGANVTAIGGTFTPGAGGTETATINSLGGNIIDGVDPANALTHPTDQSGVTNLASSLGSLKDNGGLTPTIVLLSGSPAIDAGVTNSLASDQRGISRPQGSGYDSGAFELAVNTEDPGATDGTSTEDEELANTGQNRGLLLGLAGVFLGTPIIAVLLNRRVRA